ncbi:MAG TPA: DNA alkylation repair protein [Anaerolineales bacterium]
MPAIQLARLKIHTTQLAENFAKPAVFVRSLHELLDYYSDRTYRPGQAGEPPPLLKAYNVPTPVLRHVLKELVPDALQDRPGALRLIGLLWEEPFYEFRQLAISLVGQVPPDPPEDILKIVRAWAIPSTEMRLLVLLFKTGLTRVRKEFPQVYLRQVDIWLASSRTFTQQLGLQALLPLVADPEFDNLPVLFRMLAPLVRDAPVPLRPDLLDIMHQLARRSPKEAAFFLRQNLTLKTDNPGTAWLTRHSLAAFPPEIQANLRSALREAR